MVRDLTDSGDEADVPDEAMWSSRRWPARGLRIITYLAPVAASALAIFVVARWWPQPGTGSRFFWYASLLLVASAVSLVGHRVLQRLLPLALLLEMSLCFPESAPSRLRLARRTSSAAELKLLMLAPQNETAQEAAERMLKLLAALQAHDRHTRGHAERVRAYADLIAESMGMAARDRDRLKWAALLHDIGKLHVPVSLLNKPAKPDAEEWEVLRAHPAAGNQIAAPLLDWLAPMDRVILEHHERWDGSGYPAGKVGREVSEGSRIVQVADAFEVMTAARAYKRPVRKEAALRELVRCAGTQFDPAVVRALVALPNRWLLWAAGPAAWLAQVPLLGSNTASLLGAAANQIGAAAVSAAAGATIVAAATLNPVATTPGPVAPASVQTQAVETGASVSHLTALTPGAGGQLVSLAPGASARPSSAPSAHRSSQPSATPSAAASSVPGVPVASTPAAPSPTPPAPSAPSGSTAGGSPGPSKPPKTNNAGGNGNGNANGHAPASAAPSPVTSSVPANGKKPPK